MYVYISQVLYKNCLHFQQRVISNLIGITNISLKGETVVIKSSPCPLIRGSSNWSDERIVITGKTFWKNDFICTVVYLETEETATNSFFDWFEQQFIIFQKTIKINVLNLDIKSPPSSSRLKLMMIDKVYINKAIDVIFPV